MVEQRQQTSLLETVKAVAEKRKQFDQLNEQKRQLFEEWEKANQSLLSSLEAAREQKDEAEKLLRELAVSEYMASGNKQPAPGVGIREMTRLEYFVDQAFQWAMEHKIALTLDKKAFETVAKSTPIEFVKVYQEAQATIATDLEKALEGGK